MLNIDKSKMPISQSSIDLVEKPARQTSATMEMVAHTLPANIVSSETLKPVDDTVFLMLKISYCAKKNPHRHHHHHHPHHQNNHLPHLHFNDIILVARV